LVELKGGFFKKKVKMFKKSLLLALATFCVAGVEGEGFAKTQKLPKKVRVKASGKKLKKARGSRRAVRFYRRKLRSLATWAARKFRLKGREKRSFLRVLNRTFRNAPLSNESINQVRNILEPLEGRSNLKQLAEVLSNAVAKASSNAVAGSSSNAVAGSSSGATTTLEHKGTKQNNTEQVYPLLNHAKGVFDQTLSTDSKFKDFTVQADSVLKTLHLFTLLDLEKFDAFSKLIGDHQSFGFKEFFDEDSLEEAKESVKASLQGVQKRLKQGWINLHAAKEQVARAHPDVNLDTLLDTDSDGHVTIKENLEDERQNQSSPLNQYVLTSNNVVRLKKDRDELEKALDIYSNNRTDEILKGILSVLGEKSFDEYKNYFAFIFELKTFSKNKQIAEDFTGLYVDILSKFNNDTEDKKVALHGLLYDCIKSAMCEKYLSELENEVQIDASIGNVSCSTKEQLQSHVITDIQEHATFKKLFPEEEAHLKEELLDKVVTKFLDRQLSSCNKYSGKELNAVLATLEKNFHIWNFTNASKEINGLSDSLILDPQTRQLWFQSLRMLSNICMTGVWEPGKGEDLKNIQKEVALLHDVMLKDLDPDNVKRLHKAAVNLYYCGSKALSHIKEQDFPRQ
jgi:ribosomal protein L12E/L44/L45/RPP1/RPP2/predicted DNA-binding protein YlxM (UPF0122 family)